jgi:hypothetical protein
MHWLQFPSPWVSLPVYLDYVYTRAIVSGFVKVSGFLVFQVYGSARRLHYTARHSDGDQYNVNNFNPLSDVMRCFYPVWRLNLIAIHLKNIHRNKLIQILYGKPFTRIQGFRIRPTTEMIFHRIRRGMCKPMYESDAKTFRFCDESGIFRSSVNGVL